MLHGAVAINAGVLAVREPLVALLGKLCLPRAVHLLVVVAGAAACRVGGAHFRPDDIGQTPELLVELLLSGDRPARFGNDVLDAGPGLLDELRGVGARYVAVDASGAHARAVGVVKRRLVHGIDEILMGVTGGAAELVVVGEVHGHVYA